MTRLTLRPGCVPASATDTGIPLRGAIGERATEVFAPHIDVLLDGEVRQRVVRYDVARGEVRWKARAR